MAVETVVVSIPETQSSKKFRAAASRNGSKSWKYAGNSKSAGEKRPIVAQDGFAGFLNRVCGIGLQQM